MVLPDNNSSQKQIPEQQSKSRESGEQEAVNSHENAAKSSGPQPVSSLSNDDIAAQKIAKNLKNNPVRPPLNGNANPNPQSVLVKKASSSEPYIKAAENVIEKDKDDPYKEEEDHEDVQIQYLKDRFGKDVKKGD